MKLLLWHLVLDLFDPTSPPRLGLLFLLLLRLLQDAGDEAVVIHPIMTVHHTLKLATVNERFIFFSFFYR